MLELLVDFVDELRVSGLPVSLTESINAADALRHVELADRSVVHAALRSTLVKSSAHAVAFDHAFDVYFSGIGDARLRDLDDDHVAKDDSSTPTTQGESDHGLDAQQIEALVREALESDERDRRAALASLAVSAFAGILANRPVGVSYYLHRTLRALDLDSVLTRMLAEGELRDAELAFALSELGTLGTRLLQEEYAARVAEIRRLVEDEIRRRLAVVRGAKAMLASTRRPLIEDVDFMHATQAELIAMRRMLRPLAKILAARLVRKRRHRGKGSLDFRATIRSSLSSGGVPITPHFRAPHHPKPEIFVLADVSGSVASFARFTLHLVYVLGEQFSKLRSFAFIDGLDEVSTLMSRASSITDAVASIAQKADVVHLDGHSDYGHAFEVFRDRFAREVTTRTNLIILGDARNNYHGSNVAALAELAGRARRVYWLNPEPRAYWGSGDSIIDEYFAVCDGVFECRNLRQLEGFIDELGERAL